MEGTETAPSSESAVERNELPAEPVEITETDTALKDDNTQYDLHVRLIGLLQQVDLPEQLEIAREQMHEVYPLPESMWIDWINDTLKEADTEEGEQKLRQLYDKADNDYLSIDIWKSYVDFILKKFHSQFGGDDEGMKDESEAESLIEEVREDLLKAVRAANYHVARSHEIWNAYAGFESEVLERFKNPVQLARVKQCYLDRLNSLHIACEDTFSAYSQFVSNWDNSNYETNMVGANKIYAETKVASDERDIYEQQLKDSGYSLDVFYQYIENEKASTRKSSLNNVRNLYERAILLYCTDVALWDDYMLFLNRSHYVLYETARGLAFFGHILLGDLSESSQRDREQIIEVFDRALSNKTLLSSLEDLVTVLTAKCDYERRRIDWEEPDESDILDLRVAFEEACVYISEAFPETGDPFYRIEKYYAFIEAKKLDNDEKARELWEGIVKKNGQNSEAWVQYIDFERSLGNIRQCASLFKRALPKKLDYPERLMNAWIAMEHEIGSIETIEEAYIRVAKKTKSLMRQWQVDAVEQEVESEQKRNKDIQQKVKKAAHRRNQKMAKKERSSAEGAGMEAPKAQKRKAPEHHDTETFKKPKLQENKTDNDGFRVPAPRSTAGGTNRKRGGRLAFPKQQNKPTEGDKPTEKPVEQGPSTSQPKSNDDFRAMLLGKK
ncbi:Splicing factor [Apophysomyces sp. BC1034]|nr:Splicing factor [Apophysomyces sp. BC1015]KAG0172289.1 Splicing factor [Apophysomyces sp. BC1021]KAG0184192.1 Splicing factor [Apophysomyces sp. BC1034]